MNFQRFSKLLQIGPYRHYSYESLTSQLEPSLFSNFKTRSLLAIFEGAAQEPAVCRPEDARRWRGKWRGGTKGPCAPARLPSSARGGLWPTGRVSRRSAGGCSGGDGATAAAVARKGEPKGRRTTGKVLAHTVGLEGARGGENAAAASLASRPWRTHVLPPSGARRAREGASREWRRGWRARPGLWLSASGAGARGMEVGALLAHGGHVHGQVPPVEAFHRARGGQRHGQGGTPFWAASRPN